MLVRPATPADAAAVERVVASGTRTLREVYRPTAAAIAGARRLRSSATRLVAELADQIAGTVELVAERDVLRLFGLHVEECYRRRGVARALVAAVCDHARALGLARVTLHTVKETGNVAIFARLGFVTVDEHPDPYSISERYPQLTDVAMAYDLGQ